MKGKRNHMQGQQFCMNAGMCKYSDKEVQVTMAWLIGSNYPSASGRKWGMSMAIMVDLEAVGAVERAMRYPLRFLNLRLQSVGLGMGGSSTSGYLQGSSWQSTESSGL